MKYVTGRPFADPDDAARKKLAPASSPRTGAASRRRQGPRDLSPVLRIVVGGTG